MRLTWFLLLLSAAALGCINRTQQPISAYAPPLAPVRPTEGIYLESVLLERPVGDQFLDREIWDSTLPISPQEKRVLLDENGIRVGVLSGNLPQQLQDMLGSETEAINGRGLTFANRKEEVLPTTGPHDTCGFQLLSDLAGARTPVELKNARSGLQVRPTVGSGQRVSITCEPRIQHGERQEWLRPSADRTVFVRTEEVPVVPFPTLAFDVSLGRGDFLLVGWHAEQRNTLGESLFFVEGGNRPRQRVLLIRAWQLNPDRSSELPLRGARSQSLAAQVARTGR